MASPTIEDVARLADLTVEAASRVVGFSPFAGKDARTRVQQAIVELGHIPPPQPKPPVARQEPWIVLVHGPDAGQGDGGLRDAVIAAMAEVLSGTGFDLALHRVDPGSRRMAQKFSDFLEQRKPSGVLLLPPVSEHDDLAGLCWEFGCPHVRMASAGIDHAASLVFANERQAAADAVHRLASLGHVRIALIGGPEGDHSAQERELGYLDALADLGLDRGPSLVATGDGSFASGHEAGRLLLEVSPRPTAILAVTDEMAAGALHAAHEAKLAVPGALSIAGFADSPLARMVWPPLSSVRLPLADMARSAVQKLLQPEVAEQLPSEYATELVERSTTGPAPE